MKKLPASILISLLLFTIISCGYEPKKNESNNSTSKNETKTETQTKEPKGVVGSWKWIEWSHSELTAAEKQQIMNAAELEFTADGKFITRTAGKSPSTIPYAYDENNKTLTFTIRGNDVRYEITFNGDKMTLRGTDETSVYQRK